MRKFLVVVDQTVECMNALHFAARRAQNTGGGVVMLYIIPPEEFQHWIGVGEVMRAEARAEAEERLSALAEDVSHLSGVMPIFAIREGIPREEVLAQIAEDPQIGVLVLGSAVDGEGPGPLVSDLVGELGGAAPIPVTVVPGSMTLEHIDKVC